MGTQSDGEDDESSRHSDRKRVRTEVAGLKNEDKYKVYFKTNYTRLFPENNSSNEYTVYLESKEKEKLGNKNPLKITQLFTDNVKGFTSIYRVNAYKIGVTFKKASAANNFLKLDSFLNKNKLRSFIPAHLVEKLLEGKMTCESGNICDMNINYILDSCRVCMARCSDMCCIFDEGKTKIISDIEFCTGVLLKNENGLPTKVCESCLLNLSVAFNFKSLCLLADNTFRKILDSMIKTEPLDEDINLKNTELLQSDDNISNNDASEVKEEICTRGVEKEMKKENDKHNTSMKIGSIYVNNPPAVKIHGVRTIRGPYKKRKLKNEQKDVPNKSYKINPLSCVICDLKFENKLQAVRHRKDHHMNTKCWLCEICGKVFVHRGSHYSHVKSHHPPDYACNHCDYKTWQKHDLAKHLRRHDGIKLYQCEYCTASYYIASNLINHIRRIHQGEKRYSCDICQKRFYDRPKLNRHVDSHNDIKRFECDVCHACFTRRCYWKKHLLRQHGVVTPPQRPGRQKINFLVE